MTGEQRATISGAGATAERGQFANLLGRRGWCITVTSVVVLAASTTIANAQSTSVAPALPAPVAAGKTAPRTSWGKPDLSGFWTNSSMTRLEREPRYGTRLEMTPDELRQAEGERQKRKAFELGPSDLSDPNGGCDINGVKGVDCAYNSFWTDPGDTVMRVGGKPRTSFITSTPDGAVPDTKAGVQFSRVRNGQDALNIAPREGGGRIRRPPLKPQGGPADDPEIRSVSDRCLLSFGYSNGPVMLPQRYNANYSFVLTKDVLAIESEMVHDVRQIRIGGKHRTDGIRPWMGDSIGWWEGDTLVAETTNYHPLEFFYGSDENLKVTERFTRVGPNRIRYQFKVEDPTVWAQPWGGEYEFGPSKGPVYEYACHEGNYALEGILSGARIDEGKGVKTAKSEDSE